MNGTKCAKRIQIKSVKVKRPIAQRVIGLCWEKYLPGVTGNHNLSSYRGIYLRKYYPNKIVPFCLMLYLKGHNSSTCMSSVTAQDPRITSSKPLKIVHITATFGISWHIKGIFITWFANTQLKMIRNALFVIIGICLTNLTINGNKMIAVTCQQRPWSDRIKNNTRAQLNI